jgi:hypothetical protein
MEAGKYDIELTRVGFEAEKDGTDPNAFPISQALSASKRAFVTCSAAT